MRGGRAAGTDAADTAEAGTAAEWVREDRETAERVREDRVCSQIENSCLCGGIRHTTDRNLPAFRAISQKM